MSLFENDIPNLFYNTTPHQAGILIAIPQTKRNLVLFHDKRCCDLVILIEIANVVKTAFVTY